MFTVQTTDSADIDFVTELPLTVQATFDAAFSILRRSATPLVSGAGWHVEELRQKQRLYPEGMFSLHVGPVFRGLFVRQGQVLKFFAFGAHREPRDVYAKLGERGAFVRGIR